MKQQIDDIAIKTEQLGKPTRLVLSTWVETQKSDEYPVLNVSYLEVKYMYNNLKTKIYVHEYLDPFVSNFVVVGASFLYNNKQ